MLAIIAFFAGGIVYLPFGLIGIYLYEKQYKRTASITVKRVTGSLSIVLILTGFYLWIEVFRGVMGDYL